MLLDFWGCLGLWLRGSLNRVLDLDGFLSLGQFLNLGRFWRATADWVNGRGRLASSRGWDERRVDLEFDLLRRSALALAEKISQSFLLESLVILLRQDLLWTGLVFRGPGFGVVTVSSAGIAIASPIPMSRARSVSQPVPIPITIPVVVAIPTAMMVAASFSALVALLLSTLAALLPLALTDFAQRTALLPFLLPAFVILFASGFAGGSLLVPLFLILLLLDLPLELPLLLLHPPKVLLDALSLGATSRRVSDVFLVGFGAAEPLQLGSLCANLSHAKLAHVCLDGVVVKELVDDGSCLVVDIAAVDGAID